MPHQQESEYQRLKTNFRRVVVQQIRLQRIYQTAMDHGQGDIIGNQRKAGKKLRFIFEQLTSCPMGCDLSGVVEIVGGSFTKGSEILVSGRDDQRVFPDEYQPSMGVGPVVAGGPQSAAKPPFSQTSSIAGFEDSRLA